MAIADLANDDRKGLVALVARRAGVLDRLARENFLDDAGLYQLIGELHLGETVDAFSQELVRVVLGKGDGAGDGESPLMLLLKALRKKVRGHADELVLVDRLIAGDSPPVEAGPAATPAGRPARPFTILFLAANPAATVPLRLGAEARTIAERLRESPAGQKVVLEQLHAARYQDLSLYLLEKRPQVLHFSGHGDRGGTLVFERDDGRAATMDTALVADVFGIVGGGLRCVLLNACWSEAQARAIGRHVDFVVGMNQPVPDAAARRFAAGFYRGLGFGRSVQTCFELARNEMASGSTDPERMAAIPQLLIRPGTDADVAFLAAG